MSNPDAMVKKTEPQQRPQGAAIVIYDLVTRKPLPGYEPRASGVVVWLPDNGRDNYAGRISA